MSEVDVDDYAVERAIPDFGRCYCFTPGAMSAFVAEVERAAAARALEEVRSTIGAYQEHGVWAFDQAVKCIERARAAEIRERKSE